MQGEGDTGEGGSLSLRTSGSGCRGCPGCSAGCSGVAGGAGRDDTLTRGSSVPVLIQKSST